MRLDQFTPEYIEKIAQIITASFGRRYPWYREDITQTVYLALYSLRQQLTDRFDGGKLLRSRYIYSVGATAVKRAIIAEKTGERLPDIPAEQPDITLPLLLSDAQQNLKPVEKKVLRWRYFRGMTQTEIGAVLGISQQVVSEIMEKALNKMRENIGGE